MRAAAVLAVLLAAAAPAGGSTQPSLRVEGPFGRGAAQVWLLRPASPPRSVVVFGHGWKTSPPSTRDAWVRQFAPWLAHLVAGGSAVLFPRYQLGGGDDYGAARVDSYRAGLRRGFSRLGAAHVPVVAAGYSYGASLAFYYAANAARWRLPRPAAVDAVFPAGMIPSALLPRPPRAIDVLIEVGDRDSVAGPAGARAYWRWLGAGARRHLVTVRSRGSFVADHAAPKLATPAARRAFWLPLDRLLAAARS
ncbi:MAG TPA: hypothetical protein VLD16_10140 [Gaiellaceae bacterium]|nr:hypothetical protein [Gaiellaceae bacterium]